MRRHKRKQKKQANSQIDIQPQLQQPRPFIAQPSTTETVADLQTLQEKTQQPSWNFSDIPIFAARQASNSFPLQPKLTIGAPGDKYEQEADRLAHQVVSQINAPIQAKTNQSQGIQRHQEEKEELQTKPINSLQRHPGNHDDELHMKPSLQTQEAIDGGTASTDLESSIQSAKSQGQPLNPNLQQKMGQAMGADFSGVKVHTNQQADTLNRSLHSRAFTTGQDLFFKQGEYQPDNRTGQELIAHELTHVVQQSGAAVQRHPAKEEDNLRMKPELQRHEQEEELQRKNESNESEGAHDLLNRNLVEAVQQPHITPIQRQTEASHGNGCPCPSCHTGKLNLQRKTETSHDAGCNCQNCVGTGGKVQAKFASGISGSNLNYIMRSPQQSSSPTIQRQTTSNPIQINNISSPTVIRRHSSHEHYLLGQTSPDELAGIPLMRELADKRKKGQLAIGSNEYKEWAAKKNEVKHTIRQHVELLKNFIHNPDFLASAANTDYKEPGVLQESKDGTWEVPYIKLQVRSDDNLEERDSLVILYGELNALPDFFSNLEALEKSPKTSILNVLQGVRQRTYKNLLVWHNSIIDSGETPLQDDRAKIGRGSNRREDFQGAVGPRDVSPGMLKVLSSEASANDVVSSHLEEKEQDDSYFAGLERNACHFAPYSWDTWKKYHEQAMEMAEQAYFHQVVHNNLQGQIGYQAGTLTQDDVDTEKEKQKEVTNKALLLNGFGDHFLQDSFASGHLVDKTLIMQKFAQWLAENNRNLGSLKGAQQRWQMTQMVAHANLESNPQELNDSIAEKNLNFLEAAELIGLSPTPAIIFMMWWREQAAKNIQLKKALPNDIVILANRLGGLPFRINGEEHAQQLLEELVAKGLAKKQEIKKSMSQRFLSFGSSSATEATEDNKYEYHLKQAQINSVKSNTQKISQQTYNSELVSIDPSNQGMIDDFEVDTPDYETQAAEFNVQAYNAFLSNSYLQIATNVFHDEYCLKGLEVLNGNRQEIGKIYGDRSMLNAGAQKGVKYSAETAALSRNALLKTIRGQHIDQEERTEAIKKRFPHYILDPISRDTFSLENWNSEVLASNDSFNELIKKVKMRGAKAMYKANSMGSSTGGHAINMNLSDEHGAF